MSKIVCGFLISFVDSNDINCLMLRRSSWVSHPCTWSIPIGHAEEFEIAEYISSNNNPSVLLEVALRELKEETNLSVEDIGNVYNGYLKLTNDSKDVYIFSSIVDFEGFNGINQKILLDSENDDYSWFNLENLDYCSLMIDSFSKDFDLYFTLIYDHINSIDSMDELV